jgi:3-deoxy-D-manno-octulosonic-acid transferase
MWILYQIAVLFLTLVTAPFFLLTRGLHYRQSLGQRLGFGGPPKPVSSTKPLWIHAVSVGEVGVANTLAQALPELLNTEPLVITTITPTGQAQARANFPRAYVTYLPFELGFAVNRFFDRFSPRALVLCEGDLWPLVLRKCKRKRLPIVVVNGRISDRSFGYMTRLRRFLGPVLSPVDHFAVQSDLDRKRLEALGVAPTLITVTGNLKFESTEPHQLDDLEAKLSALAARRPILVAGSTMHGEESLVLDAFEATGSGEVALLILAPRHPERWDTVESQIIERGFQCLRISRIKDSPGSPAGPGSPTTDIVLLDSMGDLASIYRLAAVAFIGGTLVSTGGHNPLEAARFGVPVVAGPSMENFREIAAQFDRARAWRRVDNVTQLAQVWSDWLSQPASGSEIGARGAELIRHHRGAARRTAEVLRPLITGTNDN